MKVCEQLSKVWGEMAHVPEAGGAGQHADESLRRRTARPVPLGGSECNGDVSPIETIAHQLADWITSCLRPLAQSRRIHCTPRNGESGLLHVRFARYISKVRALIWREIDFLFTGEKGIVQIGILQDCLISRVFGTR
jgi:hypothetical protein